MRRTLLAVLVVALLLPSPGASFHNVPDPSELEAPQLPPVPQTGYPVVDERAGPLRDRAQEQLDGLFDTVTFYTKPTLDLVPRQPVTLYRDSTPDDYAEPGNPEDFPNALGLWTVHGDEGWRPDASAASPGEDNERGHAFGGPDGYDGGLRSVLLMPEVDLRTGNVVDEQDLGAATAPRLTPYRNAGQADTFYFMEFAVRFNLGPSDRVRVLVYEDEAPDEQDLLSCGSGCTNLDSFQGSTDWQNVRLDLDVWAEQRIWVALVATTVNHGAGYFDHPAFDDGLGFYGLQFDEVRVKAPASPLNVQVHELVTPTGEVHDSNDDLLVRGFVRNTGATRVTVETLVDLVTAAGTQTRSLGLRVLGPGDVQYVDETFEALGADNEDTVARVRFTLPDQNDRNVDAYEPDNQRSVTFDVLSHREIHIHEPELSDRWVPMQETVTITTVVHNHGTSDDETEVQARLVDCDDPARDLQHLLQGGGPALTLAPDEARELTWTVDGSERGQYRLFLHSEDREPFLAQDCDPATRAPLAGGRTAVPIAVDGQLDEDAWQDAGVHAVTFGSEDGGQDVEGTLRVLNTDTHLYLAVEVPGRNIDQPAEDGDDQFLGVFFDDLADRVLLPGEDGFRVGPQTVSGAAAEDLAYDPATHGWTVQGASDDAARAFVPVSQTTPNEGTHVVELRRPLARGDVLDGLRTPAGGEVGLVLRIHQETTAAGQSTQTASHRYPAGAALDDGDANKQADGSLDDETVTWALLETVPADPPRGSRVLSAGFGVGTGPPLVWSYEAARDGCDLVGWDLGTGFNVEYEDEVVGKDRWNCGYYEPEGRVLLYEGTRADPGKKCGIGDCPPYSSRSDPSILPNLVNRQVATLTTEPVKVAAADPFLLVKHQYATAVDVMDRRAGQPQDAQSGISVLSIAYAEATITEGPRAGERLYLVPTEGYDTEATTGLADPRFPDGTRAFRHHYLIGGPTPPMYCNELSDSTPGPARNCGWWHPTGPMEEYRPLDDEFPLGGAFHGSPWKLDRIDLHGMHPDQVDGDGARSLGQHMVDLRGETVQFQFHFVQSARKSNHHPLDTTVDPPIDYGWRIDALAVTEGARAVRDAAVLAARLATPYDADELGVGPDTWIPVEVEVANTGLLPLSTATVSLVCTDADRPVAPGASPAPFDAISVDLDEGLAPGQVETVVVSCKVPSSADGNRIRVEGGVLAEGGDDLALNDRLALPGLLDVRASPDVAVRAAVTPTRGSADFVRAVGLRVENLGNVPVSGFDLDLAFTRSGLALDEAGWTVSGTIPVGEQIRVTDPRLGLSPPLSLLDLFYDPPSTGEYSLVARVSGIAGDVRPANDLDVVPFQAVDTIYGDDFGTIPETDLPGLLGGNARTEGDVWRVVPTGTNSGVLRAGDAEGALPPGSDGSFHLPPVDLTSASQATLAMVHRYAFEENYDGGRVEVTADGGQTWEPLVPRPSEGLPEGYPDNTLVGSSGLLDGQAERRASAFTGESRGLPGATADGWIRTEFDLGDVEALQQQVRFAEFPLGELTPDEPTESFTDGGERYFHHADWSRTNDPAEGWAVDNLAYNEPKPHSGQRMWWSGSQGHYDDQRREFVHTTLGFPVDLRTVRDPAAEQVYLAVWDWRAGWQDHERILHRDGTGGSFRVFAVAQDGFRTELTDDVRLVRKEADGWSLREVPLTFLLGQTGRVEFEYRSDDADLPAAQFKNNEGWFLDDLAVKSYLIAGGERTQPQNRFGTDDLEPYSNRVCDKKTYVLGNQYEVTRHDKTDPAKASFACWSLVTRGAQRDHGWHIEDRLGPEGRAVPVWSIAEDIDEGYPRQLNSRLVTPPVDLRTVVGRDARLQFDHQYGFSSSDFGDILSAIDAGVVEVQVYDPVTGEFGPWRQLAADRFDRTVVRRENSNNPDAVLEDGRDASGYPGLLLRGNWQSFTGEILQEYGYGWNLEAFPGICNYCNNRDFGYIEFPLGYAYSGDSGGWQTAEFDITPFIGEKVRFAFHAWSNPTRDGAKDLLGWEVANVRVEGTVFQGAPVEVRLRAATDESRLDGFWEVDELELSGAVHRRNLAVGSDEPLEYPAGPITRTVHVTNLGTEPRSGLALAVRAVRVDDNAPVDASILGLTPLPTDVLDDPIPGLEAAGPFFVTAVGDDGGTRSFDVTIPNPPTDGTRVRLEVSVLEDLGEGDEDRYATPNDAVVPNTRARWDLLARDFAALEWEPAGSGLPLEVEGAGPASDGSVAVAGTLRNTGTAAAAVDLQWTLTRLGGATPLDDLDADLTLLPGASVDVVWEPDLPTPTGGLYTVRATVAGAEARIDFPVQGTEVLWTEAFDVADPALPADWMAAGPGSVGFRTDRVDDHLSWGTHPFSGNGYCGVSRLPCAGGNGYLSVAQSPPIDLTQALNDRATLGVDHAFYFNDGDGGQVRAAVVDVQPDGSWQPRACDGGEAWTLLTPVEGVRMDGETRSTRFGGVDRFNPLGDASPVFSGPVGELERPQTSTYDLSTETWCPGGTASAPFLGSHVVVEFRVGIQDTPKTTRPGWQVDAVDLASGGVELGPVGDGVRTIPIIRNAPKTIGFTLTNLGAAEDTYRLTVEPTGELDQPGLDAVRLLDDEVELRGGEQSLVRVKVDTPETLPAGRHEFRVIAESTTAGANAARSFLTTVLEVEQFPKANLVVTLNPGGGDLVVEQGSVVPVHAHVSNVGSLPSKRTTIAFSAIQLDKDGEPERVLPIETLELPPICPAAQCGAGAAVAVVSAEWAVPTATGAYRLVAHADPSESLLDLDRGDNRGVRDVQVVPLQLPDLEVTSIEVDGAEGNAIEAGSLATVRAKVTNVGEVPTSGATLRILAGSVTLTEATVPLLEPGHHATFEAAKVVPAVDGRIDFRATVLGGSDLELRDDNNEAIKSLLVRTHDVRALSNDQVAAASGGTSTIPLRVSNHGNAVERLSMEAKGPEGWTVRTLTPLLLIPPGGEVTGLVLVKVPADAEAGSHPVAVDVSSGERVLASISVPVQVVAELTPAKVTFDVDALRATEHRLPLVLESRSNAAQTLRVTDRLGWLVPLELDLAALAEETVETTFRIPSETPPGTVADVLSVAPVDGSWEASLPFEVTVEPTLDVAAEWVEVTHRPSTGNGTKALQMALRLRSLSNLPVDLNVTSETGDSTAVARVAPVRLEPGEERTLDVDVFVDERAAGPDGLLRFGLRNGDLSAERTLALPDLRAQPDLTIVAFSADPAPDGTVLLRALVRNDGPVPAGASLVHFYADGVLVQVAEILFLPAGREVGVNATWRAPAGDHHLLAMADGDGRLLELHEDNNGATTSLRTEEPTVRSQLLPLPAWLLVVPLMAALVRRRWTR